MTGWPLPGAAAEDLQALERRVEELTAALEEARAELDAARAEQDPLELADAPGPADEPPPDPTFRIGPVTVGGAMRVNYVYGSYEGGGSGPSRGGNGGDVELDTFRVNLALEQDALIGAAEYRWYNGYNFIHTGWLGYRMNDDARIQVGVTRVPFGPGPYGISQSWFFDQHYYVGLSDDMDLGIRYVSSDDTWDLDLAYFYSSEGNWNGASRDSARYSYDAVKWASGLDENGNIVDAPVNGYEERNQVNARVIRKFDGETNATRVGVSLQYGELEGKRADDGHHWAASAHMINEFGNLMLATQLTRYHIDIDGDNPLGTDTLMPMGAYDFAWPVATDAWLPAVSLSYRIDTPRLGWLDYVRPYAEYSNIMKREGDFNDSEFVTLGAAWANKGWYIYSEAALSNGNYFVGDRGDNYANILDGVGDFGVNGNDQWNWRINLNFGYYY